MLASWPGEIREWDKWISGLTSVFYNKPFRTLWLLNLFIHVERRRQWHPTPVLLPGKSHGRRSLVGCSPWGRKESDSTEWLHFHFSLSCTGEGNGNLLQCSCLESPRDRGAWWAAVSGVAQGRTRLKRLSSSSSIHVERHRYITLIKITVSKRKPNQDINHCCL